MQKTCSRGHVFEKNSSTPTCPVCWPGRYKKAMQRTEFSFRARVWMYPGATASWHFLSVPEKTSMTIKKQFGTYAKGWGSLPVDVTIGKTSWKTSLFPDTKRKAYLLPLKAAVRKREDMDVNDLVEVTIALSQP